MESMKNEIYPVWDITLVKEPLLDVDKVEVRQQGPPCGGIMHTHHPPHLSSPFGLSSTHAIFVTLNILILLLQEKPYMIFFTKMKNLALPVTDTG